MKILLASVIMLSRLFSFFWLRFSVVYCMDDIPADEDAGGGDVAVAGAGAGVVGGDPQKRSVWDQTVLAAQQLGIIVGVALLVGGGFMLMVGIELSTIWVVEKLSKLLGTQTVKDPEDPAALVGSFKRYK